MLNSHMMIEVSFDFHPAAILGFLYLFWLLVLSGVVMHLVV
jgi:hypothetical protein